MEFHQPSFSGFLLSDSLERVIYHHLSIVDYSSLKSTDQYIRIGPQLISEPWFLWKKDNQNQIAFNQYCP